MKFARRWHISRWNTHTLSYVVPLEEHTGSSNDGQLSTQMHRASLGPNALQTAKYLQETLMHGSRSVNKWYTQQFKMPNLGQIKCQFSYLFIYLFIYLSIQLIIFMSLNLLTVSVIIFCRSISPNSSLLIGIFESSTRNIRGALNESVLGAFFRPSFAVVSRTYEIETKEMLRQQKRL